MNAEIGVLAATAASMGFFHTLLGPDHYLPFIVMSRSGKWSTLKTFVVTTLCGIGHIASSVVLGFVGIALGIAVTRLEAVEGFRGGIAAWLLIGFGLAYFVWGLRSAAKNQPHVHKHLHADGSQHEHKHTHAEDHIHVHKKGNANLTPWILFTIFVFGPCEPLIPILMYPAAQQNTWGLILVTATFGVVTLGTMLGIVMVGSTGINFLPAKKLERWSHALAGASIFLCGMAIQFLGL